MSSFRRRLMMAQHGAMSLGYMTDGLLCHYDGILNNGNGHNNLATAWADISGNNNHLSISSNISWQDDCCVFNGSVIRNDTAIDGVMCAEVVLKADALASVYVGFFGSNCKFLAMNVDSGFWTTTNTPSFYVSQITLAHTAATNFSSSSSTATTTGFFIDGNRITATVRRTTWNSTQPYIYLGCYNAEPTSYPFHGKIYAVRLYNRNLTAAEIAQNAAVDAARFNF